MRRLSEACGVVIEILLIKWQGIGSATKRSCAGIALCAESICLAELTHLAVDHGMQDQQQTSINSLCRMWKGRSLTLLEGNGKATIQEGSACHGTLLRRHSST
jgi:hypothetical protein